jgi:hypothetical protein
MKKHVQSWIVGFCLICTAQALAQDISVVANQKHTSMYFYTSFNKDSVLVQRDGWSGWSDQLIGFKLKNLDTLNHSNWESGLITTFEADESQNKKGYYIKINAPDYILLNSSKMWCSAVIARKARSGKIDTTIVKYGGVDLSRIKLILKTTPEGAETFLIPNRIWKAKVEKENWKTDLEILENFRVNTSATNTTAYINETVYVVLFKRNNSVKKVTHFTKPFRVEQEQTVWVNF